LSRATRYAVEALVHLAREGDGKALRSHDFARPEGIPERFMLKCLKLLVNVRLLLSLRGPNGGYRLAKPASKISLLEVVEAVDGPIRGDAPLNGDHGRDHLAPRLEVICDKAATLVRKQLSKVRISDLVSSN